MGRNEWTVDCIPIPNTQYLIPKLVFRTMSNKIKIGIVGGAGYAGGELLRILVNHPHAEIDFVLSKRHSGQPVSHVHSDLLGDINLNFSETLKQDIDVLFLCVGHGEAKKFIQENPIDIGRADV